MAHVIDLVDTRECCPWRMPATRKPEAATGAHSPVERQLQPAALLCALVTAAVVALTLLLNGHARDRPRPHATAAATLLPRRQRGAHGPIAVHGNGKATDRRPPTPLPRPQARTNLKPRPSPGPV